MNASERAKYQTSKYIVKKWEREFKNSTGSIPTKTDIKAAPRKIKEAYSTYWKLKTLELETSLLDVTLDENAKDSFNNSVSSEIDAPLETFSQESCGENSQYFKAISISTLDTSESLSCKTIIPKDIENGNLSELSSRKKSSDQVENDLLENNKDRTVLHVNPSEVWGDHLRQKTEDKPCIKKQATSVSSIYAQKLFVGSKFNKRNPRKPRQFKKNQTSGSLNPEPSESTSSTDVQDISNISMSQNDNSNGPISEITENEEKELNENHFNLLNEKMKVVIKSTPQISYQGVSLLQNTFNNTVSKNIRALDQGWLERVNSVESIANRASIDSGIENKDSKQDSFSESSTTIQLENKLAFENEDSGEDLIYDSDSESQSFSQHKIDLLNSLSKAPSLTKRPEQMKRKLVEDDGVDLNPHKKIKDKESSTDFKNIIQQVISNVIEDSKNSPSVPKSSREKKLELLEKKLESGKANENFVRINIEKKVFVRGKKNKTFSTFKKQKWKAMQKKKGGSRGAPTPKTQKCFKCGDVGHFAKDCHQVEKSVDVYEFEEECPLPSLNEAEEMAKKANVRRRTYKTNSEATIDAFEGDFTSPQITEERETVKPVFNLQPDETPALVYDALRDFGYTEFRFGQEKAIMRVLSGKSTLVTLATGTGKSLCYQLPAYIYAKQSTCISLVVSPLVSLMEDQVYCGASCLRVACLHTNQTKKQREVVMAALKTGELSVLLVSPEALASGDNYTSSFLKHLPPIAFACIDEAHCVSQWSHNFRPSYLTVCQVLREKLGITTILGLTATATASTIKSILHQFGVDPNDEDCVISDTPLPNNLCLSVSSDRERDAALLSLLNSERFADSNSVIIYCTRREQCDILASFLRAALQSASSVSTSGRISIHAEAYHAGLSAARRKKVQSSFMSGKLRIVVATIAFGMGINKNNIRAIIHYNMPSSFENYVQEVGRAGRDGKPASCHVFLDHKKSDLAELKRHIYSDTVDRHTLRKLLELVFVPCKCGEKCSWHEIAFPIDNTVKALDLPEENILTLLAYLELHEKKWLQVLSKAYTKCKVSSYKGPRALRQAAKTCAPLAVALAMAVQAGQPAESISKLEFDVIRLARIINWDSGAVKHTLKNLEWITVDDKPKKSGISVELSELGIRLLSPGNLTGEQLDSALDLLNDLVQRHEQNRLQQLKILHNSLNSVTFRSIDEINQSEAVERSDSLKAVVRRYFQNSDSLELEENKSVELENEDLIVNDIRQIIMTYHDRTLTGRNIARIFHGIGSPNFPPIIWGRTRFWRAHLSQDFNLICKLANKQIILMR